MRVLISCCLAAIALVHAAPSAKAATPIPADTQAAADFLLATCRNSAGNLAAVTDLAGKQNWTSMLPPGSPGNDPIKVAGMWRVSQGGQTFAVTTGTGPRGDTNCMVLFGDPRPRRDDFFAAMSNAWRLKAIAASAPGDWRTEMYQIEDLAPKNVVLQFVSSDGKVYEASITGRPQ